MTYHSDPTRWTQSPGEAPELLRGGLEAAGREGPSDLQMRALALKLAAVGTGAALAAGAAGAKASTTAAGAGLAVTGSSVLTKIAVSVALIGAAATGGTLLLRQGPDSARTNTAGGNTPVVQQSEAARPELAQPAFVRPSPAQPALVAPRVEARPLVAPAVAGAAAVVSPAAAAAQVAQAAPIQQEAAPSTEQADVTRAELAKSERRERRHARAEERASEPVAAAAAAPVTSEVVQIKGEPKQASEIDLLSKARSALAARPREAYRLTEEHKSLFPQGVFAQERDALAVEALQRSGDLTHARALAEVFLKRYPSSPAAHRFRETMHLP